MQYFCDYHMHSNNSIDGKNSVMELCRSAIEKGLSEIAITDHFEPTKDNVNCTQYKPDIVTKELQQARERFGGVLRIKMGVELGQPHHYQEISENIINSYPYDYVIGSAHKLEDGRDVSELDYKRIPLDNVYDIYLKELKNLALWGKFDCMGHLDLIKRYSAGAYKERVTLLSKRELLEEVFRIIIEKGKGIEINTSGLRQQAKETLPGIDVLKLYRSMGGEILTIGSDAHFAQDVGKGLVDALELAQEAGFDYITVFNNRQPSWRRITLGQKLFSTPA